MLPEAFEDKEEFMDSILGDISNVHLEELSCVDGPGRCGQLERSTSSHTQHGFTFSQRMSSFSEHVSSISGRLTGMSSKLSPRPLSLHK